MRVSVPMIVRVCVIVMRIVGVIVMMRFVSQS
jgi:hypothetical protein